MSTECALRDHRCYEGSVICTPDFTRCDFCDNIVCFFHSHTSVYYILTMCNKCVGEENLTCKNRGIFEASGFVYPAVAQFYKEMYNMSKTKRCK